MFNWTLIALLIWVVPAIISYGVTFAYLQRRWPNIAKSSYRSDMKHAMLTSLWGPFRLFYLKFLRTTNIFVYGYKFY